MLGCPLDAAGCVRPAALNDGNGCANRQSISHSSDDHEQVQTARIDYNINAEQYDVVPISGGYRRAGRLHRSDQSPVRFGFSAAALFFCGGLHARLFAEPGELFQSRPFPGTKACSVPAIFRRRSRRFPSCCKAVAQMRRSPPSAAWTTPGFRAGAPRDFSSTTIWPGATGAHELRFGTNTRIFRLNDYDFGEGTRAHSRLTRPCRNTFMASRPRRRKTFPHIAERAVQFSESRSLRAGHLEGDKDADLDFRPAGHVQFQSAQSASTRSRDCADRSIPSRTM